MASKRQIARDGQCEFKYKYMIFTIYSVKITINLMTQKDIIFFFAPRGGLDKAATTRYNSLFKFENFYADRVIAHDFSRQIIFYLTKTSLSFK